MQIDRAVVARGEDSEPSDDANANQVFEAFGDIRNFMSEILNRNSIDDQGARLDAYIHYGKNFSNAHFDGRALRLGDGDGERFTSFTGSLDVIAHEVAHGITASSARLDYYGQPGALHESFSDVFASLVRQWKLGQTVEQADWLIGAEVWTPGDPADALRSLKAPGTAYVNHPIFKTDPQPGHMNDYAAEQGIHGGAHLNSGIPNKAFYEAAMRIGGCAWEVTGIIWYQTIVTCSPATSFQEFADKTRAEALQRFGALSAQCIAEAWREVGISTGNRPAETAPEDPNAALRDMIADLSARLGRLEEQQNPAH